MYSKCAALLKTIQYTQLLCEMFAKRAGEKVRWRVVVVLEMVKAILRLCMGYGSGGRAIIGTVNSDERQERQTDGDADVSGGAGWDGTGEAQEIGDWKMPRTGMRLPQIPSSSKLGGENITDFLGKRVIGADEIKSAKRLVRRITSAQGQIAELMWVLRPFIYALALQRCQANRRDWKPWVIALTMEVVSRRLANRDVMEGVTGGLRGLSGVEREELTRRSWSMAWWTMRGAFYENVTHRYIKGFAGKFKGKPLFDMVSVIVDDYDYLWSEYYFSTATM